LCCIPRPCPPLHLPPNPCHQDTNAHSSQYLSTWRTIATGLTDPPSTHTPRFGVSVPSISSISSNAERQSLKDAATLFYARLAEIDGIARQGGWNRLDVEMRERVGKEVEAVVGDAVRRFWTRCEGKGLEKCEFLCLDRGVAFGR
jgi:exocyst complex protein 7